MKVYLKFSMLLVSVGLTSCQVFPDKYVQQPSPEMIEFHFLGYNTGSEYVGKAIPENPRHYRLQHLVDKVTYLKPDTDYAIQSSGYASGGKCGWQYIIHTPKKPQVLTITSKSDKRKCFASASTSLDDIKDSGFTLRKLAKGEKAKI